MNQNIKKLTQISQKNEKIILGLMSGTSLDGLDLALCKVKGFGLDTKVEVLKFTTYPYSESLQHKIREVFAKDAVKLQQVCLLHSRIGNVHARMILSTLQTWGVSPQDIDIMASHGQTIYHAPKRLHLKPHFTNSTLQLGDADHLAHKTGIITISDFRQKHIAAGGEGAPLAVYGDYLLFSSHDENRVLLNVGGIANFTYLPAGFLASEVFSTDTGAGNTLIDTIMRQFMPPKQFDEGGKIAGENKVNQALLQTLKNHPFFLQSAPKTTGQELFNLNFVQSAQASSDTLDLSVGDVIATLTRFSAETIAETIANVMPVGTHCNVYVSGGGAKNLTLMNWLKDLMPHYHLHQFDELGYSADAKEAILFAVLANETLSNEPLNLGRGDLKIPAVSFGKISFPI
ncbi:MAG: anhydro-N-acetylmuramic acid kinase [Bacteroidetes bacterium]|nr:MAG: anhydro-N-acetylmuramic acid kinase [Bacteroidota bacterium]